MRSPPSSPEPLSRNVGPRGRLSSRRAATWLRVDSLDCRAGPREESRGLSVRAGALAVAVKTRHYPLRAILGENSISLFGQMEDHEERH